MSELLEIPLPTDDSALYTIRITLEGVEYILKLDWNDREKRWYLSVYDIEENILAAGIKIISNWPLLFRYTDIRLPPGSLIALDLSPLNDEPPEFYDLGIRVKLYYRTSK